MPPANDTDAAARQARSAPGARARAHLIETLTPVVESAGYDLDDVTVTSAGRRSLVRVVVDADGGIDLDAVADVSRLVSEVLDGEDDGFGKGGAAAGVLGGAYTLEVTSPGVDRPLTEPRHWRRALGRLVAVDVAGKSLTGRVTDAAALGVTLEVDGTAREIAYADLGRGKVQVEFNRPKDATSGDAVSEDATSEDEEA